jgi:hypothetical protein
MRDGMLSASRPATTPRPDCSVVPSLPPSSTSPFTCVAAFHVLPAPLFSVDVPSVGFDRSNAYTHANGGPGTSGTPSPAAIMRFTSRSVTTLHA